MSKEKIDRFFKLENEGSDKLLADKALELDKKLAKNTKRLNEINKKMEELSSEKANLERDIFGTSQRLEALLGVIVDVMDSKEDLGGDGE